MPHIHKNRGEKCFPAISRALLIAAFLLYLIPACAQAQNSIPEDPLFAQARTFLHQGKAGDADRVARQFLAKHPDSADGHFLLGLILFKEAQTGPALTDAYDAPPSSVVKYREEKAQASLAEFTEGAKYRTPSAFDLKIVALDYVLSGDFFDADKWLTRSLEWNPQDGEGWYYLGRTKYNENRFEEAISAFRQCLKLQPKNAKIEDNLGLSYAGLNRVEDAIAAYLTAIQWQEGLEQKDAGPFIDLGSLLLDQDRTEESLPYLLEAVAVAPAQSKSHELLGKAYSRLDQLTKAQSELEKAVALAPQEAHLHFMLGHVYRKEGLIEKAKHEFDLMSQLRDDSVHTQKSAP